MPSGWPRRNKSKAINPPAANSAGTCTAEKSTAAATAEKEKEGEEEEEEEKEEGTVVK